MVSFVLTGPVILHPRGLQIHIRRLGSMSIPVRPFLPSSVDKVELLVHPEISTHHPVHTPATLEEKVGSGQQIQANLPASDDFPSWVIWFGKKLGAGFWLSEERDPRVRVYVPGTQYRRRDDA